jgi:hypothetical protein
MQQRPKRETVKAGAVARLISEEMLVMKVLLGAALAAMVLSTGAAFAGTGGGNGSRQPVYADAGGGNGCATVLLAGTGGGNGSRQPVYADAGGGNGRATVLLAEAGGGNGSKQPKYA